METNTMKTTSNFLVPGGAALPFLNTLNSWEHLLLPSPQLPWLGAWGRSKGSPLWERPKPHPQSRHRWVIYTTEMNGKNTYWDVDGSMVPPEWHRWLHSMTDDPPTTKPPTARKFIWTNHKFNVSGTPEQYVPYSTTRKKIQEWVPPSTPYK
uniref:NADH dehydrogenase [ubiquinone] 1 alpha subcomplex subunit 12 n=1 Tax=Equus asinus asinus TaxID=83772 RepID=A0A8C4PTB4_EQUAS